MTTALVIIDMQQGMFTDVVAPHRGEEVRQRCADLLKRARAAGTPVFHVQHGIDRLVVAGMQSDYCVDTACRAAKALGYSVVLANDAHTTFDNKVLPAERIVAHHNATLDGAFVELANSADIRF